MTEKSAQQVGLPIGMLAELTHRCPLQCPYCSNPKNLLKANRELPTADWQRVFEEAADLGILQVHLSGGEPTLRRDLEQLVQTLSRCGVYTNLITAGVNVSRDRLAALADAGLEHGRRCQRQGRLSAQNLHRDQRAPDGAMG